MMFRMRLLLGSLPSGPNCTNLQCECFQMPKQYNFFFPDLCVKILDAADVVVTLLPNRSVYVYCARECMSRYVRKRAYVPSFE